MIALYLGMIAAEAYYLFEVIRILHEQFGAEMAYDNLGFLTIITLIGAVPAVIAYAVGRHISGQQTKPWWLFFLLGGLIIFASMSVNSLIVDTQWGADNLMQLLLLVPLVLSFLLAWLPLGRVSGARSQRPFDCPHCGHSSNKVSRTVDKADEKVMVCAHCQGHMKKKVDAKRLAIWLVPTLILIVSMWINFAFITPLVAWLVVFTVLLYLMSLRMQPVPAVTSAQGETI